MFKKSPNVKNLSVLRASDRKKIIQQIIQQFNLDNVDQEAKNTLLPDGAQSAKFITNLDEPGVLYYDSQGIEPLWIRVIPPSQRQEVLIPTGMYFRGIAHNTVYSLWQEPSLLKSVSTWDHVLDKLQGGADLMTPGLTHWNSEIKSGNVTAVTLQNGVPIAVGIAAFDIGRLSKAAGEKGKAVYLVHCYKDELWGLGTKTHPPSISTDLPAQLEEKIQQLSLEDNIEEANTPAKLADIPETDSISKHEDNKVEPSLSEIDDAFKMAAIYGLYQVKISDAQNTISFPMPSSTLISSHLNPYLPEAYAQYNFKKTSWKKAGTFLKKYLEKEGIVKTKDRGGETIILSINWDHKFISEFEPYYIGNKETGKSGTKIGHSSTPSPQIQVQELFKPAGKALTALLESQSKSKNELYNAAQIRDALTQYINKNTELVDSRNPRNIKIDYNLANLLKPEESNLLFLPRDKVLDRLLASSSAYYTITTEQETQTRKGKPPKIHVVLEKRQGRKSVTRFWGLEAFFINPNELAEELRNICATSASVGAMHTSTPKQPLMEVLIQGPQTTAVIDALEKRGVKRTLIVVEDKRK